MKHKFAACLFLFSIIMLPTADAMKKKRRKKAKEETVESCIREALTNGHEQIFEILITQQAQVPKLSKDFLNELLPDVIGRGWLDSVKLLLERGADLKTLKGIEQDWIGMFSQLLLSNEGSNKLSQDGLDLLLLGAITKIWVGLVEKLLSLGTNPLARRVYGSDGSVFSTALQLAISNGTDDQSLAMVKLLFECKDGLVQEANEIKDGRGNTILHKVARAGKQKTCSFLVSQGVNSKLTNCMGTTAAEILSSKEVK